ncbi:EAL domain-containing protein [Sulfurirhabdus autotrophica]|uniref:Response regulator receiver modulated diguanylate cyclase/phosphodiesterase with PAS/PAC sensor n=1 Tax=Sulfurirhabdus autotrophica TaxID=1706046 RepID=A0A4V2W2B5_9PROT|nr:EAL domain-containing protein [Sulfurirhabdus autotrophica]TCV87439.1 response regulator receiver modulated diguanylate cyclase/phosphodiesterase with PAS/PAC sensor [Sulfurirhabdus autotrophica]
MEKSNPTLKCLLIDDNPDDRALAIRELQREFANLQTVSATDMQSFQHQIALNDLDLIITDYHLQWSDGLTILRMVKETLPNCPVIMFTGTGSEEIAVEAMKIGLDDYVLKSPKHYALLTSRARSILESRNQKTLLKIAKNELMESETQLRTIIESEPECVKIIGSNGRLKFMNASGLAMIDADSLAQVVGQRMDSLILPEYQKAFNDLTKRVLEGHKGLLEFEITGLKGRHRWLETHAAPLVSPTTGNTSLLAITRDITEQKLAKSSQERLNSIINSTTDFIGLADNSGHMLYWNQAGRDVLGISADQDISQTSITDILPSWAAEIVLKTGIPTASTEGAWSGEYAIFDKKGTEIPVSSVIIGHKKIDGSIDYFSAIMRDISERTQHKAMLDYLANHDTLTGLPNRALFVEHIKQELLDTTNSSKLMAVIFINLGRFKAINDALGHDIGDRLLQVVAERLNMNLRHVDSIGRIGGDEFALVLPFIDRASEITGMAEKFLHLFDHAFVIENHELFLNVNIGIALYPNDADKAEDLIQQAAIAMGRAKELGIKNSYQFFSPEMNASAMQRLSLDNALHHALERNEFLLFYQPQIDISKGTIVGMEALIRWQHPEHGLISPLNFIPLAEETGLIIEIGEWVVRTACLQNKAWQDMGLPHVQVSVNLSGFQFTPNLAPSILAILKESRLDPRYLELEITESTLMQNTEATLSTIKLLNDAGLNFAIDDFGTGYSSLSYLKRFPISTLKIDQSFVRDVTTDPSDAALTGAIIAMAHSLNINIIAEGVETIEQIDFLTRHHCNTMQGYYFSKPLPAEQFSRLLAEGISQKQIHTH